MSDDDDYNTNTVPYDLPVDTTGAPISWDGNPASLAGIMYETSKFYIRKGLSQPLIAHGGVLKSNGKLAVDSANAVYFIQNNKLDPRSFEFPAPPSEVRRTKYNARPGVTALVDKTSLTEDESHEFSVAPFLVQQHDSRFLSSLGNILKESDRADELLDGANGSGRALIFALRKIQASATGRDRAVIATEYSKIIDAGIKGEVKLESVKEYYKKYNKALRNLSKDARPKDEAEVEMWSTIAYKDPELRDVFEQTARSQWSPSATCGTSPSSSTPFSRWINSGASRRSTRSSATPELSSSLTARG